MAIFSGTGVVGKDSELTTDEGGIAVMSLFVDYAQQIDDRGASWVECVVRGAAADRLSPIPKGAWVEFHLNDLRIAMAVKGEKQIPKLTGTAVSLRVIG